MPSQRNLDSRHETHNQQNETQVTQIAHTIISCVVLQEMQVVTDYTGKK